MGAPISTKDLGINAETGLRDEVRATRLIIDTDDETIRVFIRKVMISNTGFEIDDKSPIEYVRYNDYEEFGILKFDELRNSAVGRAIASMINQTLLKYPDLSQEKNIPPTQP